MIDYLIPFGKNV